MKANNAEELLGNAQNPKLRRARAILIELVFSGLFGVFDGIDSTKYSLSQHRSVMNYNSPADFYNYSSGPPFDDWEYLKNEGFFLPAFCEDIGIENIQVER